MFFFVNKVMSQGYSVKFGDDFCEVTNNQKKIVAHGVKKKLTLWTTVHHSCYCKTSSHCYEWEFHGGCKFVALTAKPS